MPLDGTALPAAAPASRRSLLPRQAGLTAARKIWDAALCAQVDPELWFPEVGEPAREAKAICAACPVRATCLDVFGDLPYGVVGGQSAKQRRARRVDAREDGAAA